MALNISHHERVPGHPHRWHVHLHGRSQPIAVELPEEERRSLELSEDEIHALLPSALEQHAVENPDMVAGKEYHDVNWDTPVRLLQTHFMA